jgi:trimethylamine--corrinoid protein Co-methyltransferase
LSHFKREFWFPRLFDRSHWDEWQAAGARSMGERVQVYLEDILRNHRPVPLASSVQEQINALLANAEARYAPSR